ncbi:putative nucleotidyltransferase substrate binding domain-containing protein [Virgisporangium aurantiacum]|uniref:Cyclic nucleotide-binding protein n=1 Tax=Virgisporangium aurantiacum TaxID=175570 RepID=A0A8J3Z494_9ACTN|nr:putative nucleotidyltransferase substrate binding domain-containing protein [Virgisporangium aurantiacum]GIJ54728.1 cyclic nucleotide-binding protein [Virgisporangium aurantiacum]
MQQIADFLAGQPPFDALPEADLDRLVGRVEVEYFAAGAVVVAEDVERVEHLWVVRTGALEVLDRGRIVDLLGPGDMFGHLWLLAGLPPRLLVRVHEESLLLRIPDPRTYLDRPDLLRFAAVHAKPGRSRLTGADAVVTDRRLEQVMRPIVWATAADPVRTVAERIGTAGHSCALVRTARGLGIVTDYDFRRQVATGRIGSDAPIGELATVPALTVEVAASRAAALVRMVEHGVHHLVVTDAGAPVGIVRVVDLAGAELRDPILVRAAVENATTIDELADAARLLPATIVDLCDDGVPAVRIGAVHAAVVDAIVRRVLELHRDPVLDGMRMSWVVLGSLARREPLPLSDVDTALVWADPAADPAAIRPAAREVLRDIQRCGLTLCVNGANAHNPLFSRSRSGWIEAARHWQHDPTTDNALLLSAMVADSRPLTEPSLGRALTDRIRSHTRTTQFLRALLDEALAWRPPTGFVRDFVVHHTGEHRGQLDLKAGGLMPVVGLARWIAVVSGDASGTTPDRLRRGAETGLLSADEADTLAGGFGDAYSVLLNHEVAAMRTGGTVSTYIDPRDLDLLTRRHLRESFRAVALIQNRIDRDWIARAEPIVSA